MLLPDGAVGPPEPLAAYLARGGWQALPAARALGPDGVLARLGELRGRGGAGFPVARKWALARAGTGAPRYLVANGGEHEPGSAKDRALLSRHPHTVLEGMAIAAHVLGARTAHLYLIEDMTEARAAVERALVEARQLLGVLEVRLVMAPASYVAGEETAALEVIEGRPPRPRRKPPYPGEAGLLGCPTVVNNVETLAHLPALVRGDPGAGHTRLFTLDGRVHVPGVHELPVTATLRDLIQGRGGGPRSGRAIKAILPALSARFLPAEALDCPLGEVPGCGGVSFLEEGECAASRAAEIARFFAGAQCGQCPPCRMETATFAAVLAQVLAGRAGDYTTQLRRVAAFAAGKGACRLPEMAAAPVLSALELFPQDFARAARASYTAVQNGPG